MKKNNIIYTINNTLKKVAVQNLIKRTVIHTYGTFQLNTVNIARAITMKTLNPQLQKLITINMTQNSALGESIQAGINVGKSINDIKNCYINNPLKLLADTDLRFGLLNFYKGALLPGDFLGIKNHIFKIYYDPVFQGDVVTTLSHSKYGKPYISEDGSIKNQPTDLINKSIDFLGDTKPQYTWPLKLVFGPNIVQSVSRVFRNPQEELKAVIKDIPFYVKEQFQHFESVAGPAGVIIITINPKNGFCMYSTIDRKYVGYDAHEAYKSALVTVKTYFDIKEAREAVLGFELTNQELLNIIANLKVQDYNLIYDKARNDLNDTLNKMYPDLNLPINIKANIPMISLENILTKQLAAVTGDKSLYDSLPKNINNPDSFKQWANSLSGKDISGNKGLQNIKDKKGITSDDFL